MVFLALKPYGSVYKDAAILSWELKLKRILTGKDGNDMGPMSVRSRTLKVFNAIKGGCKTLRQISIRIEISKSSVDRSRKAIERRNCYPESWMWETEDGQNWLRILVIAILYFFGIKCGIGAETLSIFFTQVHLNNQFGSSPTAILSMLKKIENLLVTFQQMQEEQQRHAGSPQAVIAGGDETFFRKFMLLVLMDLPSGYLLMEKVVKDRSYETWKENAQERLDKMGLRVIHFVSDRAKALIKLALDGFECQSGADLFHGEYDIIKWIGSSFSRQLGRTSNQLENAKTRLALLNQKAKVDMTKVNEEEIEINNCESALKNILSGKNIYRDILHKISTIIHPFSTEQGGKQTSEQVEKKLQEQAEELRKLAQNYGISDIYGSLEKFIRQINDISSIVTAWWTWTEESLATSGLEPWSIDWLLSILLPVIYWHRQVEKTKNQTLKIIYKKALESALAEYHKRSLTQKFSSEEIERWRVWAGWMVDKFQRTSLSCGRTEWLAFSDVP